MRLAKLSKTNAMIAAQPFLRWAGSKRKLLPKLGQFWDGSFERYIEPFMGSACLFFSLQPTDALLSDINEGLVSAFKVVRNQPDNLARCLKHMARGKRSYYRIRALDPGRLSTLEGAARFIFLNRFCFNGLYRTNLKGNFNVPFGAAKSGCLPDLRRLREASRLLQYAAIRCSDFEEALQHAKSGDFVYLDPPFAVSNRRVFKEYGPRMFMASDLGRLADLLERLDAKGVAFVVSYAYCAEALRLFRAWPKQKVFVNRNIAGFGSFRRRAAELLVTNIA